MSTDELQALGTFADLSLSDDTQRAQAALQVARSTGASRPVAALKRCQE